MPAGEIRAGNVAHLSAFNQVVEGAQDFIGWSERVESVEMVSVRGDALPNTMSDLGIVPLYHQENVWATRKGIAYTPRADERTFAFDFRPQ